MGLLLILAILNPILKLLSTDFNESIASLYQNDYLDEEKMKNLIENNKTIIQAGQQAYIVEQMAVPMENIVEEELVNKYGVHIKELEIQANEQYHNENLANYIEQVSIKLTKALSDTTNENTIEVVEKVEVNISDNKDEEGKQSNFEKEIQAFLAKKMGASKREN